MPPGDDKTIQEVAELIKSIYPDPAKAEEFKENILSIVKAYELLGQNASNYNEDLQGQMDTLKGLYDQQVAGLESQIDAFARLHESGAIAESDYEALVNRAKQAIAVGAQHEKSIESTTQKFRNQHAIFQELTSAGEGYAAAGIFSPTIAKKVSGNLGMVAASVAPVAAGTAAAGGAALTTGGAIAALSTRMGIWGIILKGVMGATGKATTVLTSYYKELDQAMVAFRKATNAGNEFDQSIIDLSFDYRYLGVTSEAVGKTFTSLYQKVDTLSTGAGSAGEALGLLGGKFEILGVEADIFGESAMLMIKSFDMTETKTESMIRSLEAFADTIDVATNTVLANFNQAMQTLAAHGAAAEGVFYGLQRASRAASVDMSSLMGIVGESFDTFAGSARIVADLNGILGGPYLNSLEMVRMTENERLESLIGMMRAHGMAFRDLDRWTQKSVAHALGIKDIAMAQRLLDPDVMAKMSKTNREAAKSEEELNEKILLNQDLFKKLENIVKGLVIVFKPLITSFHDYVNEAINAGQAGQALPAIFDKLKEYANVAAIAIGVGTGVGLTGATVALASSFKRLLGLGRAMTATTTTMAGGIGAAGLKFAAIGGTVAALAGGVGLLASGISDVTKAMTGMPDSIDIDVADFKEGGGLSRLTAFLDTLETEDIQNLSQLANNMTRLGNASTRVAAATAPAVPAAASPAVATAQLLLGEQNRRQAGLNTRTAAAGTTNQAQEGSGKYKIAAGDIEIRLTGHPDAPMGPIAFLRKAILEET
jgi:hypothetical protein